MESNVKSPPPLLEVRHLKTHFFTRRGVVKAVNDVSFDVMQGETLGLVGESGSGKTITVMSILQLLPRGAEILGGEINFENENLLAKTEKELGAVRGKKRRKKKYTVYIPSVCTSTSMPMSSLYFG